MSAYLLDCEPLEGSLDEFLDVNEFDDETRSDIRELAPGERFDGGGGAWAPFSIERVA